MLDRIIAASLRNRGLVLVLTIAVTCYGAYQASQLPIESGCRMGMCG